MRTYNRYRLSIRLLLLALLFSPGSLAMAQDACERELADAQEHYTFGRFDQAIQVLNRCLGKRNVSVDEQRQAYRLVSLSYIGQDDMGQARASVRDLLRVAPSYQPDRDQDPPPFVDLVRDVKREIAQAPRRETDERVSEDKGGISKWVLIGGGVVLAGVAAVLLTSGGGDDGGGGETPDPTTLNEQEPNDAPAQAQVVRGTAPITVRGNAEISDLSEFGFNLPDGSFDDFEDWYQITLTSPGVQLRLSGLASDCDLYLMEPSTLSFLGTAQESGTVSEEINLPNLSAGTYLIAVSIFDQDPQGPASTAYTLTIDAAVSGNSQRQATASIQKVGGAEITGNFRLVAYPGADAVPLAAAAPPTATSWTGYQEMGYWLAEHDGTEAFRFRPGHGFWMQSDQPIEPSAHKGSPVVGDAYTVPLESGWNIIANPFGSSMDWSAVQVANGISQGIWRWEGHFSQTDAFTPAHQGEAFYFMNATGLETLTIPAPAAARTPLDTRRRALLKLTAYREGQVASAIQAGFAPDAALGFDSYDQFAPPDYFEAARLRLTRAARGPALATEVRPWQGEGQAFEMELAAPAHAPITLRADGLADFSGQAVYLVDMERSVVYDLHRQPSVTLVPEEATYRLRLIIGTESFVETTSAELVPQVLSLGNYPNPFNPSTSIAYTVPSEGQPVRLEIFDMTGRRVQVLVDGVQSTGAHQVTWGGTDRAGMQVASGVYLARLHVGEQVRVHRMLLMK